MGFVRFCNADGTVAARYGDECRICDGTGSISEHHGRDGRGPEVTAVPCWSCAVKSSPTLGPVADLLAGYKPDA